MAKPLLKIHCIVKPYCKYPVAVRITMDDGTVQTYGLENRIDYQFEGVMKSLEKVAIGYQYKGKHTKKCRPHRSQL